MQKVVTFLWFDKEAEEAATFYCSLLKNSRVTSASAMTVTFELDGQEFMALNGGPQFKFTEAISLMIKCDDQAEVDYLWEKLVEGGGSHSQCGWLKDKYGLSWQIVPKAFERMMKSADANAAQRVMGAMMKMTKFDIATLEKALKDET